MIRSPYDQTTKAICEVAIGPFGQVIVEYEVHGEPQYVDVVVERPMGTPAPPGLLGRMVKRTCMLEAFHDPPGLEAIRDCLCKQLLLHRKRRAAGIAIAPLWIVSAGRPDRVLHAFRLVQRDGWPAGVYGAGEAYGWNVVVASELPAGTDTLLIRLMGAGETLRRALADLRALDPMTPECRAGLAAVNVLRWSQRAERPRDPIEEAIAMEVRETYEELWRRWLGEGRVDILVRLFERKLGHPLADDNRNRLLEHLDRLGPDRLTDIALDLDATALTVWLADPQAR